MLKLIRITLLLIFAFCIISCKKNDVPEENNTNEPSFAKECISSRFSDTIYYNYRPIWITEDFQSSILLLCIDDTDILNIIKIDPFGNIVWTKSYPEIQGRGINIIQAGDSYYVNTGTYEFTYNESAITYNNVNVEAGYVLSETNTFFKTYERTTYTPKFVNTPANNVFLTKLDTAGNIIWSNDYIGNYFPGSTLDTTNGGNLLLLTSILNGFGDVVVMDNGIFKDTILRPTDDHQIKLHKISVDGTLIWETAIDSILELDRESAINNSYISLCCSQDKISINTKNASFDFDLDGNVISRFHPVSGNDACLSFKVVSAFGNSNYYYGLIDPYDVNEYSRFIVELDERNNVVWYNGENVKHGGQLYSYQNGGFIIQYSNYSEIIKYDINGNEIWTKNYSSYPNVINTTCSGGAIFCSAPNPADYIIVCKIDEQGNLNSN